MKTFWKLYYYLTDRNFEARIKNAKQIMRHAKDSTAGRIGHFYNSNGEKIRGYDNRTYISKPVLHPLISKYK